MSAAVVFEVGTSRFVLPLDAVMQVTRFAWPVRLLRAPFGCLGALDVRGELLPLLDAGALLRLRRPLRVEASADVLLDAHVLVVRVAECTLALLVDRVLALTLPDEDEESCEAAMASVELEPQTLVGPVRLRLLSRAVANALPVGQPGSAA